MLTEKFHEVINHEGATAIVSCSNNEAHVVNTWNSYINVTEDGRILIPAAGMHSIEGDMEENNKVKITVGSKEVMGNYGPGAGFKVEGTATFLTAGAEFDMMKEKFPFLTRVLEITVEVAIQTV